MNIFCAFRTAVLAVILTGGVSAKAFCTIGLDPTNHVSPFSEDFTAAYLAATKVPFSTNSLHQLESMLTTYQRAEEQAELRLTLGKIHNQWHGFIDHSKAVEQLRVALSLRVAPTVRAQTLQWRGNSYEKLKQSENAAGEYIKGLFLCFDYDLPARPPTLPVVRLFNYVGSTNNRVYKQMFEEHQTAWEHRRQAEFDSAMVGLRSSFVGALRRVCSDQVRVRELAEKNVKDERKIQILLEFLNTANQPE
jgi:hypothetical protein